MDQTLHEQITQLPWFTAAPPTYTPADVASGQAFLSEQQRLMTHLDQLRSYLLACGCRECGQTLREAYEFMGALRREHADGLLDPTLPMIERGQWEVLS